MLCNGESCMLDLLDNPHFVEPKNTNKGRRHNRTKDNWWRPEEYAILAEVYPSKTKDEIMAALPGRSWSAIKAKAFIKGLKMCNEAIESYGVRWSPGELALFKRLYPIAPKHVLKAIWPERSWNSFTDCAFRNKLYRGRENAEVATQDELEIIMQINELGKAETCRRLPNLSWRAIYSKANYYGVEINVLPKKDLDILWSMFIRGYTDAQIRTMLNIIPQVHGRALNYLKKLHNYKD